MKILAAGDIHGDLLLARKLAKRATYEQVSLVILCGDLSQAEENIEYAIQPFIKEGHRVVFVPGNHETFATADYAAERFSITNLHGTHHINEDIGLFGCGGANIGLFQLSEEEISSFLTKAHDGVKHLKKKILVTHVHPKGSMIEQFTQYFPGSEGVSSAIKDFSPTIALCSHVHEAEGVEEMMENTKVMCVGREGKIFNL